MKQEKTACFFAILFLLLISQSIFAQKHGSKKNSSGNISSGLVYQCEKDPSVIANNPGRCSKCGAELKALTMDAAMDKLSGKSNNKPELKVRKVYSVEREKTETNESMQTAKVEEDKEEESAANNPEDSTEAGDTTIIKSSEHDLSEEHEAKVRLTDKNQDGYVYQCPNCPDQLSDRFTDCEKCFSVLQRVSVEQAIKNVSASRF